MFCLVVFLVSFLMKSFLVNDWVRGFGLFLGIVFFMNIVWLLMFCGLLFKMVLIFVWLVIVKKVKFFELLLLFFIILYLVIFLYFLKYFIKWLFVILGFNLEMYNFFRLGLFC